MNSLPIGAATGFSFSFSEDNSDGGNAAERSLVLLFSMSLADGYGVDRIGICFEDQQSQCEEFEFYIY